MIINNIEYNDVLFILIPKTASRSIYLPLNRKKIDNWKRVAISKHDSYNMLTENNEIGENVFKFAVVRNPYTRAYSYFEHFNLINRLNFCFKEFLDVVSKGKCDIDIITKMIYYNQSFYVHNYDGNIAVTKLYRFENLEKVEQDLNIILERHHIGKYTIDNYHTAYDKEAIDMVKHIYIDDFNNFNYSTEFDSNFEFSKHKY